MVSAADPLVLGRYALYEDIASGGMASIHVGRQAGAVGFSRVVAVKRLHAQYAKEPEFVAMFLDEARLAARVRHPNVVETLDVVHEGREIFLVLEYVEGESLAGLLKTLRAAGERIPLSIASSIVSGLLHGLHAAHEARGPDGAPLGIVHRDVSPQNVLVGVDGVTRVVDFGVALANVRLQSTRQGQVKGKLAYMAPEQLSRDEITRASDIFAAGVVLWEICAGQRAYQTATEGALYARVLDGRIPRLEEVAPWVPPALARVVHRATEKDPANRFPSAHDMAVALEAVLPPAAAHTVGGFVDAAAREVLAERRAIVARIDRGAQAAIAPASRSGPGSGPPGAPAPTRPPPPSMRAYGGGEDTQQRTAHTLTSPPGIDARGIRRGRRVALTAVAVGASALGGVLLALFVQQNWGKDGASVAAASQSESSAETTDEPVATTSAVVAPRQDEAAKLGPTASAVVTGDAAAPPRDNMPWPRPTPAPSPSVTKLPPCDPPFYVDAEGIQRVKRECLGRR